MKYLKRFLGINYLEREDINTIKDVFDYGTNARSVCITEFIKGKSIESNYKSTESRITIYK